MRKLWNLDCEVHGRKSSKSRTSKRLESLYSILSKISQEQGTGESPQVLTGRTVRGQRKQGAVRCRDPLLTGALLRCCPGGDQIKEQYQANYK